MLDDTKQLEQHAKLIEESIEELKFVAGERSSQAALWKLYSDIAMRLLFYISEMNQIKRELSSLKQDLKYIRSQRKKVSQRETKRTKIAHSKSLPLR